MSVSFHTLNSDDPCPICREIMTDHPHVVAHDGANGELIHPVDLDCIKSWAVMYPTNPTCPICRDPLEMSSLFPWKELELNHIKINAWQGAVTSIVVLPVLSVVAAHVTLLARGVAGAGAILLAGTEAGAKLVTVAEGVAGVAAVVITGIGVGGITLGFATILVVGLAQERGVAGVTEFFGREGRRLGPGFAGLAFLGLSVGGESAVQAALAEVAAGAIKVAAGAIVGAVGYVTAGLINRWRPHF